MASKKRIYFAYDTNMWFDQLHRRSDMDKNSLLGVGKLNDWKWSTHIDGYANIIAAPGDVVYGLLYEAQPDIETSLDYYAGETYTKLNVQVELFKAKSSISNSNDTTTVFLYADTQNTIEGTSKEEHTSRMNKAMAEGIREGIPEEYFNRYIHKLISAPSDGTPQLGGNTIYFGYGSNIWLDQMNKRCPENKFMGVARIDGWKWIINMRGYANIIPSPADYVYGFLFNLTPQDKKELDTFEGSSYERLYLSVDLVKANESYDVGKYKALIYIDTKRLKEGVSKKEYVHRINMAIKDGLKEGIPKDYIVKYLRPFIPPPPGDAA